MLPLLALALAMTTSVTDAAEPVTLESYIAPTANTPDEPLAAAYSLERATQFLDSAASIGRNRAAA